MKVTRGPGAPWTRCVAGIGLAALWLAPAHAQEHLHDTPVLLFLSGDGIARTGLSPAARSDSSDGLISADVLITAGRDRLRFLAETLLSSHADHEVERLQFGYELTPSTMLWAGRFHQPSSSWNTEHNHAPYLQTAVTRPYIERWEDEGGVLPQHLMGGLLETRHPIGTSSGLWLALGIGEGPLLTATEIEPIKVTNNDHGGHQVSYTARIAFLPDLVGESSAGLLVAHHELPVVSSVRATFGTNHADINVYGAYADYRSEWLRVIATGYYIELERDQENRELRNSFAAGYLQVEQHVAPRWTVFGRHENSSRASESPLVLLRPEDFALRRTALGARWDFAHRQALTLEAARTSTLPQRFTELHLQWSGVVP